MKRYIYLAFLPLLVGACRDDSMRLDMTPESNGSELRIQAEIDQLNLTRADDSGFADGDVIGVYAVDFVNGQPGSLSDIGNNADNIAFTFDEGSCRWNSASSITFSDDKTSIDLYGYYPYIKEVDDVNSFPISVESDQRGESKNRKMSSYEASDFLWAKSAGISASSPSAMLYFKHILASVRVSLVEGEGFNEGEWDSLDKNVMVCNVNKNAVVDLSTGIVTGVGNVDSKGIVAKNEKGDFRAIVIPQNVKTGAELLKITVDGKTYSFKKSVEMEFHPTKQHTFTIQVNKNGANGDFDFTLLDEAITPWESDLTSHNGGAKEYIVVEIPKNVTLEQTIKDKSLDPTEIKNLKLIGSLGIEDFEYIRKNMKNLEAFNMSEVNLSEISNDFDGEQIDYVLPDDAFREMNSLKTCVLPNKLKRIGCNAFYGTSLSGSLSIPDSVEIIDDSAFRSDYDENEGGSYIHRNNLKGTLELPKSLRYIGGSAFAGCDFSGTLIVPEGVQYIGDGAFSNCKFFSGDLRIPDSVKEIGAEAFSDMTGLTGWIILPSNINEIKDGTFRNTRINGIVWPEKLDKLGYRSFNYANFKNRVLLPNSIINLSQFVFAGSNIKHIELPPNITVIPSSCFEYCSELSDTLNIPGNVEVIEEHAFFGCASIEALVLPKSLQQIGNYSFSNCYGLNYIRCDAIEPPSIMDNSFDAVEKDNFTVEVPEESVEAYRNAPGWREFKRISAYRNFVARPSKYNVLNNGGIKEFVLNADADWVMTECPSWCHIDKQSGNKKTIITLTVDKMPHNNPMRNGTVVFKLKGTDQYETYINVAQYDYEYDEDQYLALQSSSKGKGIDLVFIGDGYDAADISSGTYLKDMKQEMEYFFGVEPYTTYREYFNVYTAFALSEDSGVEELNTWRNTKFHVKLGDGFNNRISVEYDDVLNYCAETIPPTLKGKDPKVGCILVANTDIYEGITYTGDSFCALVTKSTDSYPYDARGLVQHEAGGHGIGWLADEYIYHNAYLSRCACTCCRHVSELLAEQDAGFALNLSINGKYKEVPWSHLIFNPKYGDIVDVYEGGYFHRHGVYRSEYNSCMNNNVPYFSTWCRQLIVERIMRLAGEKFDLEKFYANDSRAMGQDFTSTTRSVMPNIQNFPVRLGQAPIMIKGYKYGRKGGRK